MPYKDPHSEKAKESHIKRSKKYHEKHREEILKKNKTDPRRLKSSRINNWKARGVIGDLDKLYEYYLSVLKCEVCDVCIENTKNRCLDHDHETGEFRKVICRSCNNWDHYKNKLK